MDGLPDSWETPLPVWYDLQTQVDRTLQRAAVLAAYNDFQHVLCDSYPDAIPCRIQVGVSAHPETPYYPHDVVVVFQMVFVPIVNQCEWEYRGMFHTDTFWVTYYTWPKVSNGPRPRNLRNFREWDYEFTGHRNVAPPDMVYNGSNGGPPRNAHAPDRAAG